MQRESTALSCSAQHKAGVRLQLAIKRSEAKALEELELAVLNGETDMVKTLLTATAAAIDAPNHNLQTPLHIAVAGKHADIARALLDHGANPGLRDALGAAPLDLAVQRGDLATGRALCAAGAQASGGAHDMLAAAARDAAKLQLLTGAAHLELGARDDDQRSVLHIACLDRDRKAAQNLLDAGADVAARDRCAADK